LLIFSSHAPAAVERFKRKQRTEPMNPPPNPGGFFLPFRPLTFDNIFEGSDHEKPTR